MKKRPSKRPRVDLEHWYTLGEAANVSGISKGSWDHACRNRRIPCRRTSQAVRLVKGEVVAQVAKDGGFHSFARPYDPPPPTGPIGDPPTDSTEETSGETSRPAGGRPAPADRLGLLDTPSAEMVKAKEEAEKARLRAQQLEATVQAAKANAELSDFYRERREAQRAETDAKQEDERAQREADEERRRELQHQQANRKRRENWLRQQMKLTMQECKADFEFFGSVPTEGEREAIEHLAAELAKEMASRSPDSSPIDCQHARRAAINRALCPYRWAQLENELFRRAFRDPIEKYLEELYDKGFLALPGEQRAILAERLRPKVVERLRREFCRCGEMSEQEATEFLRRAVDQVV